MHVHEIAPGLWYWFAPHPEWTPAEKWREHVLCVYYEARDAVVLIDPVVPRGEEDAFWRSLDRDVERLRLPVRVLLTTPWHARDTRLVVERYGAEVWARPGALWKGPPLTTTAELPAGVEVFLPENEEGLVAFFIPEHRTLVPGDILSGTGGSLHVDGSAYEPDPQAYLASLPPLLDLPIERVLVSHGEPVLSDGLAAIRVALDSA
ncbi:MAG: Metallo-beta-lactamase superfamily [Gaiellaceae bacterium]|jgi:glyoxylase-like metal-dependent hydrolase (beta-lactamase superfamily II)|nr:Metallo-beta-lactamase superfamily [Gaiellaceae bacterium]